MTDNDIEVARNCKVLEARVAPAGAHAMPYGGLDGYENSWSTRQVADARRWEPERGRPGLQAGRMISPGSGGAMVTDHLGKLGSRTSRRCNIFLSALLRRTPLLYVPLTRSTCGCLPA